MRARVVECLEQIVIPKAAKIYENEIYSMCERISKKERIDITELYSIIAYEKLGELIDAKDKESRQQIIADIRKDKILWESSVYSKYKEKRDKVNSTISEGIKIQAGEFKCKKCGSRDCFPYNQQTRGADEGMTTFVICKCGAKTRC